MSGQGVSVLAPNSLGLILKLPHGNTGLCGQAVSLLALYSQSLILDLPHGEHFLELMHGLSHRTPALIEGS